MVGIYLQKKNILNYLVNSINKNGLGEYQKAQRVKSFKYLDHKNIAIDKGACVGFWTKDLCENFKNVICFEPAPINAECLKLNLENYKNYRLYQVGLSNTSGTKKLMILEEGIVSNSLSDCTMNVNNFINIPTKKLDDFQFRKVSYIKRDVQFHELEVIEGAVKTLKNNSPVLCIECARRNEDEINYVKKIISLLNKLNFKIVGGLGKELFFKKE